MFALVFAGFVLWLAHALAWDLAQRSPVLSYDSAQYALAARELAEEGRIATPFALPIELAKHPAPPWPLSVVQPGLVMWEALIFKIVPPVIKIGSWEVFYLMEPHQREWLTLLLPFGCFLTIASFFALLGARLIERHAPNLRPVWRAGAAFTVGLAFLLDPEAQHFAVGGMTELPFALGLGLALGGLAMGRAHTRPLVLGLLLGLTGTFRANMLWLAPLFALGAAALAASGEPDDRGARPRLGPIAVLLLAMLGFVLPLIPWWVYKWSAFGSPGWDLTRFVIWDGIGGRSWFSLYHLPETPSLPSTLSQLPLFVAKAARNLPVLLLASSIGPRALLIGGLVAWLIVARPARPMRVEAIVLLLAWAAGLGAAALSIPWLRYVFPARAPLEAAGLLATLALIERIPPTLFGPPLRRGLQVALCALVLGWGAWQTRLGNREAREVSSHRGLPSVLTLRDVGHKLRREIPVGEPIMSNLGPMLSWYSRRPVVHLALTPLDVEACRHKLEFRHIVLAFRGPERAWRGWTNCWPIPSGPWRVRSGTWRGCAASASWTAS
jgi:hypothetical protein